MKDDTVVCCDYRTKSYCSRMRRGTSLFALCQHKCGYILLSNSSAKLFSPPLAGPLVKDTTVLKGREPDEVSVYD